MADALDKSTAAVEARYVNHFHVGHNEHEFIVDFQQFHPWSIDKPDDAAHVPIVRVVMGPPFAKALLETLRRAVGDYERAHGEILIG
jgi:hypothetical protein